MCRVQPMAARRLDTPLRTNRVDLAAVRGMLRGRTGPARCVACGLALRATEPRVRVGAGDLHAACARGPDPGLTD